MFEEERQEWDNFFNFYEKLFKEEVGLVPSIYDDDDFEIDLVVGQDSEEFYGLRILQYVPIDEDALEDGDNEEEIDEIPDKDEISDEDDEDEEEDDEDELVEMIQYDFVKSLDESPKIEGKPYFQVILGVPDESGEAGEGATPKAEEKSAEMPEDESKEIKVIVYAEPVDEDFEGDIQDLPSEKVELTGVIMIKGKDKASMVVFLDNPDFQ